MDRPGDCHERSFKEMMALVPEGAELLRSERGFSDFFGRNWWRDFTFRLPNGIDITYSCACNIELRDG